MLHKLSEHLLFSVEKHLALDNADVLDAVVCALAGADFLRAHALRPSNEALARKEGWIWAKLPSP